MALTAWAAYYTAAPEKANSCTQVLLVAKGIGTNEVYLVEIDPATGQLPVSLSSVVDFGVSTSALRTASLIGNATGAAAWGAGVVGAQVLRTTPASDSPHLLATRHEAALSPLSVRLGSGAAFVGFGVSPAASSLSTVAILSNGTGALETDSGAAGTTVLRTVLATRHEAAATPVSVRLSDGSSFPANGLPPAGRSVANAFFRNDYTGTSVTTLAYTQAVASTSLATHRLQIFDSSGQTLKLAVGAAGSEVDQIAIPPGGIDCDLLIPINSRVSIKAVSAAASVGEIVINFLT